MSPSVVTSFPIDQGVLGSILYFALGYFFCKNYSMVCMDSGVSICQGYLAMSSLQGPVGTLY